MECTASELAAAQLHAASLERAAEAHVDLTMSLTAALSSVCRPLQRLQEVVQFEGLRQPSEENPLLPTLRSILADVSVALTANGIVPATATVGELIDEEKHEIASRGGIKHADDLDDLVVKEQVRPGYLHSATGSVLCPALVTAAPAVKARGGGGTPSTPPLSTPRGTRLHDVSASNTLPGLAIRYGVSEGRLARLNRLPNAQALHTRTQLRIPDASSTFSTGGSHTPADAPRATAEDAGAPLWVVAAPSPAASPSLASRIASRRQNSGDRRRWTADESPAQVGFPKAAGEALLALSSPSPGSKAKPKAHPAARGPTAAADDRILQSSSSALELT